MRDSARAFLVAAAWALVLGCNGEASTPSGEGDFDADGYPSPADCDDGNADVHPDARERCDGLDNDCDGVIEAFEVAFGDSDGDGWGDAADLRILCDGIPDGLVDDNLDCDDEDPRVHPTADEPLCDGVDLNCDGVSVGPGMVSVVGVGPRGDLAAALNAMPEGGELILCPGTYDGSFRVQRSGTIRSTGGAGATTVSGGGAYGSVLVVDADLAVTIEGITLTGGRGSVGGGLFVGPSAQVTVRDAVIRENIGGYLGGGIYADWYSSLVLYGVEVSGNSAYNGGGIAAFGTPVVMVDSTVSGNTADTFGGGLYVYFGTVDIERSEILENLATLGGGVAADRTGVELDASTRVAGNLASSGGGLYVRDGVFDGGLLEANQASYGGGVYFDTLGPLGTRFLARAEIRGNEGVFGGGLYATNQLVVATGAVLQDNRAEYGAGAYLVDAELELGATAALSGNVADVSGGGVYLTGGRVGSSGAWWGNAGLDENLPDDVHVGTQGYDVDGPAWFDCSVDDSAVPDLVCVE